MSTDVNIDPILDIDIRWGDGSNPVQCGDQSSDNFQYLLSTVYFGFDERRLLSYLVRIIEVMMMSQTYRKLSGDTNKLGGQNILLHLQYLWHVNEIVF